MTLETEHRYLAQWLRDSGADADIPLKEQLSQLGVNSRGWRLYLDYGDTLFDPLGSDWINPFRGDNNGSYAVVYLRLLQACEMDVPPPLALVRSFSAWKLPYGDLGRIPPLFLRAAWKATAMAEYGGEDVEAFARSRIVPLAQWFFNSDICKTADANLLKAGWSSLEARHAAWLEAQRRRRPGWILPMRWMEWGPYRFFGLVSEAELEEEGDIMGHCVGSYGGRCRDDGLRVYSIRGRMNARHLATLSLEKAQDGSWQIEDLKGPHNAPVGASIHQAVLVLLATLDKNRSRAPSATIRA